MLRPLNSFLAGLALGLAACGGGDSGIVDIAAIGSSEDPFENGTRLSAASQHVRAATHEGLVGLDAGGAVLPALAESWIVTDEGRSYIFRLRNGEWPDGSPLTASSVERELKRSIRALNGTSLGLDLSQISEVRAMAQRVIEIRLKGPMPDFLQLLAQPELGLSQDGAGFGPMNMRREEDTAVLAMMAPENRGLPEQDSWDRWVRTVRLRSLDAEVAVELFYDGQLDAVLDGRIENFPLVRTGALTRSYAQVDPANGLFGLMVRGSEGFLADPLRREAVSMAIDRDGLLQPFNLGGWTPTTRLVPAGLPDDLGTIGERWVDLDLDERRAIGSQRVAAWKAETGSEAVEVSIDLPPGPGSGILFSELSDDLARIGVTLVRPEEGQRGELYLLDRVARFGGIRWFLNQFNCGLRRGICSDDADFLVSEAVGSDNQEDRIALLAEAEAELTRLNGFIPLGQPVRWSLVRAGISGYQPNRWAFHSLSQMAIIPR
jgi:ABC-type transport system substrate-binding protein